MPAVFADICSLPPETGPCYASKPRYHFDPASRQCREFIYGGCEGNANNFQTIEECEKRCDKHIYPPTVQSRGEIS